MTKKQDGGPAFPQTYAPGMSLRDWFAGQALAGLSANRDWGDIEWDGVVRAAYDAADAMIAERDQ